LIDDAMKRGFRSAGRPDQSFRKTETRIPGTHILQVGGLHFRFERRAAYAALTSCKSSTSFTNAEFNGRIVIRDEVAYMRRVRSERRRPSDPSCQTSVDSRLQRSVESRRKPPMNFAVGTGREESASLGGGSLNLLPLGIAQAQLAARQRLAPSAGGAAAATSVHLEAVACAPQEQVMEIS
jgi:hypothetical protein